MRAEEKGHKSSRDTESAWAEVRVAWDIHVARSDPAAEDLARLVESTTTATRRLDELSKDIDARTCVLHATMDGLPARISDQVSKLDENAAVKTILGGVLGGWISQRIHIDAHTIKIRAISKELSDRACQSIGGGS